MWKLVCITVSWTSGLAKESKITAHSLLYEPVRVPDMSVWYSWHGMSSRSNIFFQNNTVRLDEQHLI